MWYDAHFYHAFIIKIVLSVSEGKTSSLFKEDEVSILTNSSALREDAKSILREGHLPSLSATFDRLVSPVGTLTRVPVGNALARVRKLPGAARNREAPNTSFAKNEYIKISISRGRGSSF